MKINNRLTFLLFLQCPLITYISEYLSHRSDSGSVLSALLQNKWVDFYRLRRERQEWTTDPVINIFLHLYLREVRLIFALRLVLKSFGFYSSWLITDICPRDVLRWYIKGDVMMDTKMNSENMNQWMDNKCEDKPKFCDSPITVSETSVVSVDSTVDQTGMSAL